MASIESIKASDGSGNANIATVQSTRAPAATTIVVDTVLGINSSFMGSMGTPHTFTDPVTSETITVISEATCVDFAGHVDGSNLEIDAIAPGYTDLGSAVGDIIIIRPTTQWADEIAAVLEVEHKDGGTHSDVTADSLDVSGAAAVDGTLSANGLLALGAAVHPSVGTVASSATVTPTIDDSGIYTVTALAAATEFQVPSGTPVDGQALILRIKDNGTARALTWNAIYRAFGQAKPTTTTLGKTMYVSLRYNNADSKWDVLSWVNEV